MSPLFKGGVFDSVNNRQCFMILWSLGFYIVDFEIVIKMICRPAYCVIAKYKNTSCGDCRRCREVPISANINVR